MSFWSSQTLLARLENLVPLASASAVDCNAITLTIGKETFVTPNVEDLNTKTVTQLTDGQPFVLPPSQFAFLTTEEDIHVPTNAMAFISMKATFKLMGLINVSGFHVDPGYSGPLIFSVYNAGPSPVHLRRGLPLFLIWYADLDSASENHKVGRVAPGIPARYLNKLSGTTDSVPALEQRLVKRIDSLERTQSIVKFMLAVLLTAAIGVGGAIYPLFLGPFYKLSEKPSAKVEEQPVVSISPTASPVQRNTALSIGKPTLATPPPVSGAPSNSQ